MSEKVSTRSVASIGVILASAIPFVVEPAIARDSGNELHPRGENSRRENFRNLRLNGRMPVIQKVNDAARLDTHSSASTRVVDVAGSLSLVQNFRSLPRNSQSTIQPPTRTRGSELTGKAYNLDLSSGKSEIVVGSKIFAGAESVSITLDGVTKTITPGARVTSGEYVAIRQVLDGGTQSIGLDNAGVATGGTFALGEVLCGRVEDVVIPQGVTSLDYFSRVPVIRLQGDLTNHGSMYAVSQSARVREGRIFADDITNYATGIISTERPESLPAAGLQKKVDLHLHGTGSISNYGTISSSGNLSLSAGGSISNTSAEPSSTTDSAVIPQASSQKILAAKNIDLSVGNGTLINSGEITSSRGNINVSTVDANTSISINSTDGSFNALDGAINVRDGSYSGSADITLMGGDYLSNSLNLHSGSGAIEGRVNELTGILNTNAGVEHLFANTNNLILGTNCVTGDPTFANNGNITISGVNTFAENVAIIANGDIIGSATAQLIVRGHDVVLLAGVDPGAAAPQGGTVTGSPSVGITGAATVDFASATNNGGNIDLTASTVSTIIDTRDGVASGNVVLAAFANGNTGGRVLLSTSSTIDTSSGVTPGPTNGPASGNGGNVTVIAGASPASASSTIQLGAIVTSGASGNIDLAAGKGGSVNIITAQPTASTGTSVTFDSSGQITAGGPIIASSAISANAQVSATGAVTTSLLTGIGKVASDAGSVNIHAGGSISTAAVTARGQTGRTGFQNNPFTAVGQAGGNGASVSIVSDNGGITINGIVDASGGSGADGALFGSSGVLAMRGGDGGDAGLVDIAAGNGNLTVNGDLKASGGTAGKGATNPASAFNGGAGGIGGSGGDGASISLTSSGNVTVNSIRSAGGDGGVGGSSSDGSGDLSGIDGAIGGDGGIAGKITVDFGPGTMTVNGVITSAGGSGGKGGHGGDNGSSGAHAGAGGAGGAGGNGGFIDIESPAGDLNVSGGLITGRGGMGGDGGAGGEPFNTGIGGAGGAGGAGGNAAGFASMAAGIKINAQSISSGVDNAGGAGGQSGQGGAGGASGAQGNTGIGGAVEIATDNLTASAFKGSALSVIADPGAGADVEFTGDVVATDMLNLILGSGSVTQQSGLIRTPRVGVSSSTGSVILNNLTNGANSQFIMAITTGDVVIKTSSPIKNGQISGDDIELVNTAGIDLLIDNAITGTGTVDITTSGNINVLSSVVGTSINFTGQQLSLAEAGTISGTTVTFEGSQVTNAGIIQTLPGGALNFHNSDGDLTFAGSTGEFISTAFSATAKGDIDTVGLGNLQAHSIELRAPDGQVNFDTNFLKPAPNVATDGKGGSVTIDANSIVYPNSSSSPFTIDVRGVVSNTLTPGAGGTINLTLASVRSLVIGSGAGNLQFLTAGATGTKGGRLFITNESGGITNNVGIADIDVLSETANGSISILNALGSSQTSLVALTANGSGDITGTPTITADEIQLTAGGTIGSLANAINVDTNKIAANAGGTVKIANNANGLVVLGTSSAGNSFEFTSTDSIQTNGEIEAVSRIALLTTAANGSITLNGNVTATSATGEVTLVATGTGSISDLLVGPDVISANTVNLISVSGQISSPGAGLRVATGNLNFTTTGSVAIENRGTADFNLFVPKNLTSISVVSSGNLIVPKSITSASSIALSTSVGSNKSIRLNGSLGSADVTDVITLSADGSGSVTSKGSVKLKTKPTGSISISSGSGNIGAPKGALQINTASVRLSTGGTGIVSVDNASSADVTLLSSSSGGSFTFNSAGALKVDGVTSSGGSIVLSNKSGLLQTSVGSVISAGNGSITLNSRSAKFGSIAIGANSQISTFSTSKPGGFVNIIVGSLKKPLEGTLPANVQVNDIAGGTPFFGNGIVASGPLNVINLVGTDVIFSTGKRPPSAIQLGGGVVITADPIVSTPSIGSILPLKITNAAGNPVGSPTLHNADSQSTEQLLTYEHFSQIRLDSNLLNADRRQADSATETYSTRSRPQEISQAETALGDIPAIVIGEPQLSAIPEESLVVDIDEALTENPKSGVRLIPLTSAATTEKNVTRISNLKNGSVLFVPKESMRVETTFGTVTMKKGAVVLLMKYTDGLSVFAIDDTRKNSVVLEAGGKAITLTPGTHATVAITTSGSFDDINPAQAIGHSLVTEQRLGEQLKMFTSNFCVPHSMSSVIPLRAILMSTDTSSRSVSNHLLKTAAVLMQLNPSLTYSQRGRLGATAWNQ
ncbi:MAG: hypothetical protein K2X93_06905 [Candidatus Obscuribacterales bacterium]|nr:hypothetical protein [Candidatus Obscuribacterales bacterium]